MKKTKQLKVWKSKFGKDYTLRNPMNAREMDKLSFERFGVTRTKLNEEFIGNLNRSAKILEVGSNVGTQLILLQKMGFKNLYGIEINRETIEISKSKSKNIDIIQGSALDIPFRDDYFDLVFTSGVLIHISPADIKRAMEEIHRCTKKYIWGCEYYADSYTEIEYRGRKNMLWKANFSQLYLSSFKDLKIVKEKKIKYLDSSKADMMFLLKKGTEKRRARTIARPSRERRTPKDV